MNRRYMSSSRAESCHERVTIKISLKIHSPAFECPEGFSLDLILCKLFGPNLFCASPFFLFGS